MTRPLDRLRRRIDPELALLTDKQLAVIVRAMVRQTPLQLEALLRECDLLVDGVLPDQQ